MPDSIDHDKVSEAIVKFVQHGWSQAVEQQIRDSYGEPIAAQTRFVYDAAMDCPVDWRHENMNSALAILADFLDTRFPCLSPEAKTHLNYCYIMTWK